MDLVCSAGQVDLELVTIDVGVVVGPPATQQETKQEEEEEDEHHKVWSTYGHCQHVWCKPTQTGTTGCPYCCCPTNNNNNNKSTQQELALPQHNVFLVCEQRQARITAAADLLKQQKQHEEEIALAERRAKLQVVIGLLNRVVLDIVDANSHDKLERIRLVVGQESGKLPLFFGTGNDYYMSPVTGYLITEQEVLLKREAKWKEEKDQEEEKGNSGVDDGLPRAGSCHIAATTMTAMSATPILKRVPTALEVLENEMHQQCISCPTFAHLVTEWVTKINNDVLWHQGLFVAQIGPMFGRTPYVFCFYKWWKWWLV